LADPAGELFLPLANRFFPFILQRTTTIYSANKNQTTLFQWENTHKPEVMFMGEPTYTE